MTRQPSNEPKSTPKPPESPAKDLERFVSAEVAADFLGLTPRYVLELARDGDLPAYPLGRGARHIWRFRLTDLAVAMERTRTNGPVYAKRETSYRSKPTKTAAGSK